MDPPDATHQPIRNASIANDDHQSRILNRPEGAQSKFDKLAAGPFVLTLGDVPPENFGAMPNKDETPAFNINGFGEATHAPFSYDVK